MAKFKAGDAVKLRDDAAVNANVPHSTRFVVQEIDEIRRCLLDCGYWIFEDALEAWPESTEETMSNEIDPQLFELVKAVTTGLVSNTNFTYIHNDEVVFSCKTAVDIAREIHRLLRDEKL